MHLTSARIITRPLISVTQRANKRSGFRLEEDFRFALTKNGVEKIILLSQGFIFDGPSVPWYCRWFASPSDYRWLLPSAPHDCAYRTTLEGYCILRTSLGELVLLTREEADELFFLLTLSLGFPLWKARVAYLAVRLFGRFNTKGRDL